MNILDFHIAFLIHDAIGAQCCTMIININILEVSNQKTKFYKFKSKLFIERESYFIKENSLYQFEIKDILNKKLKNINYFEQYDIQQNYIHGYLNYSINDTFLASGRITREDGDIILKIKKLDYWITAE